MSGTDREFGNILMDYLEEEEMVFEHVGQAADGNGLYKMNGKAIFLMIAGLSKVNGDGE